MLSYGRHYEGEMSTQSELTVLCCLRCASRQNLVVWEMKENPSW